MARSVTQRQLRNESGEVMRAVEAGEILIVTRRGVPLAELRPLRRRAFVPKHELMSAAKKAPIIDAERFREDVDAIVDQKLAHGR